MQAARGCVGPATRYYANVVAPLSSRRHCVGGTFPNTKPPRNGQHCGATKEPLNLYAVNQILLGLLIDEPYTAAPCRRLAAKCCTSPIPKHCTLPPLAAALPLSAVFYRHPRPLPKQSPAHSNLSLLTLPFLNSIHTPTHFTFPCHSSLAHPAYITPLPL